MGGHEVDRKVERVQGSERDRDKRNERFNMTLTCEAGNDD